MTNPKKILIGIALIVALLVLVGISAFSLFKGATPETSDTTTTDAVLVGGTVQDSDNVTPDTSDTSDTPLDTSEETPDTSDAPISTEPPVTEAPYTTLPVMSSEMYTGSLIVVGKDSPYSYHAASMYTPAELDRLSKNELSELGWVSLYTNKSSLYLLRSRLIYLKSDAYTAFHQMMTDYVAKSGNRDVQVRFGYHLVNATPDITSLSDERATGLLVEINVYTDEGSFSIDHASKRAAYYEWFAANCYKYGFIMTGESGLFRYVGVPHAEYMTKKHLDLQEYVSLVAGYGFDSPLSFIDASGILWQVYTVPASNGAMTEIKLPKDAVYSISGNNKNGFIVLTRAK